MPALDALHRLSLHTKALVIASEYTRRKMGPEELRRVLDVLAPAADERQRVVKAVEEELRAARYPMGEIVRLISGLSAEGPGVVVQPEQDPTVVVTRKVRSPTLMPFERYEFEAPGSGTQDPSGEETAGEAESAEGAKTGDRGGPQGSVSGGGPAPQGAEGHKGLAGLGAGSAPGTPGGGSPAVLVADDDGRARMMYRAKLEECGFLVVEAKDGIEAWDHIRNGAVQCAVMDMKMPGYHGLEVLGRMVDGNVTIPVIVVSAFDQLANEFVVAAYPKLKFLTKPAPPESVVEAVESFLDPGKRVGT